MFRNPLLFQLLWHLLKHKLRLMWEYLLLLCKSTVTSYQTQMVQEILKALQHQEGPGCHCILKAQEGLEDLESYLR